MERCGRSLDEGLITLHRYSSKRDICRGQTLLNNVSVDLLHLGSSRTLLIRLRDASCLPHHYYNPTPDGLHQRDSESHRSRYRPVAHTSKHLLATAHI